MKKYDLHKIMKTAHEIYRKYFKLYQLTHGVQTFGDCLKLAWTNEKKRVADEEARKAEKEAMKAALFIFSHLHNENRKHLCYLDCSRRKLEH